MLVLLYIVLIGILLHKADSYFAWRRILKRSQRITR